MSLQFSCSLLLLVMIAMCVTGEVSANIFCKRMHQTCTPLANDCCRGMTCQRGALGRWKCQMRAIGGVGGVGGIVDRSVDVPPPHDRSVCQRKNELCRPGLNNNCCPGLRCLSKPLKPNVHSCR